MSLVDDITAFLERVAPVIISEIEGRTRVVPFILMEDRLGIAVADVARSPMAPDAIVSAFIRHGATGAAYVSYIWSRAEVLAQVVVANPVRSDLRRAYVTRRLERVELGTWEYAITG